MIDITVRLRRRVQPHQLTAAIQAMSAAPPSQRQPLSRTEFANTYGADPSDIDQIKAFASQHGLAVADASAARRSVHLRGTAEAMNQAFGITLQHYQHAGGTYRSHADAISLPVEIAPLVEAVVGFDTRPYARPHFQIAEKPLGAAQPHAGTHDFAPPDLAQVYRFPADGWHRAGDRDSS
jgi:kumamolisin